jgi:hypothetical protein
MHEEVVIRHAASNQLQRNAPHCKPPAAPKRPPDRSQTAPAPACGYPALRVAITDEASPPALRSTRNRPRRAVRRGAAWTVERHPVAAWSLLGLRWRWQCCHRRASLGLPSRKRRPHRRGLGVSRRAAFVVVAIEDVRLPSVPFVRSPVRIASGSAGVPGGGDGVRPDTAGHALSGTCPIVASIVGAGHGRVDIGRGPGLRTFGHRAGVQMVTPDGSRRW